METSDKRKVFVKLVPGHSVPRSVRESDLLNHFDTLKGKIEEVSAIRGRDTAQGFVRFKTQEAAKEAIARYHGTKLYGRFQIIVRPSRGKEENYPPATATSQYSKQQQRPSSAGSSPVVLVSTKQANTPAVQTHQPRVHPRRGRVTAPTKPQVSPKSDHQAAPISTTTPTVHTQSEAAAQHSSSRVVDSVQIQAKSQEDSWPDIVPATTINLTDSEPDGQPDSSQQPSLKDLLLNLTSSSAEQISCFQAASQSYEQSHLSPVPIACAGPVSSDPSTLSRVAITNLSSQVDEDDLIPFLGSRGKLLSLHTAGDASTKTATVAYPSLAEAQEAVVNWHGKACYGLPVSVAIIQYVDVTPPPPGFPPSLLPPTSLLPINYTTPHSQYPPTYSNPYSIPPYPADVLAMMQPPVDYPMMQPPVDYPMMLPVNFPTMMQPPINYSTMMQPIAGVPGLQNAYPSLPCSVQRRISSRLCDFIKTMTAGQDFERKGGNLRYSDGCLLISANTPETAEQFASKVVDKMSERQLSLSLKQLTQLAERSPNRPSQFDELCSPFSTNPNVSIFLSIEYGQGKEPAVIFVGQTEAVNSAHLHFTATLLKELEMDRVQAAAVRHLLPEFLSSLCDELHVKSSFTNTTVCFEGNSMAIQEARAKMQQQLSLFQIHTFSTSVSSSLLASLKKRLQERDVNACALHFPPDPACMVTLSQKDNNNAVLISRKVFHRKHTLPSANLVEKLKSESGLISTLEQTHTISATIDNCIVTIEGYNEEDVITATSALGTGIKALSVTTKQLECSPVIQSYLTLRLFKQPSTDSESFLASLPVQVSVKKENLILEGTPAAISKGEKLLMTQFVSPQLKHRTFEFTSDIRFFSLIEDLFLAKQHEKDSKFYYLAATKCQTTSESSPPTPDIAGFSFTIFSSHEKNFEQACCDLENLQPHTEEIPVHPSLVDSLEKRRKTLEHKHNVRLMIEASKVSIDGLQKEKIMNCRKELEETLLISEMICLTGFQVVYLEQKFQQKIAEFRSTCQTLSLPVVQRNPKGLTDNSFITVDGKPADVECVKKGIQEILGNDLKQDTAFIKCACSVLVLWEERWKHVVAEFQNKHDILVWFGQSSSSPQVSGRSRRQSRDDHTAALHNKPPNEVVVTFLFYGKSAIVDQFKNLIVHEENGEVIKEEIVQSVDVCQSLRDAISKRKAGIHDLSVQVEFPKSNTILLLAPSCKRDDFAAAKTKLDQFIGRMIRRDVVFPCNDRVVALILKKKPNLLKEVLPSDLNKKVDVSFCPPAKIQLTGSQVDIDTAQISIGLCLSKIRATLGNASIPVDPLCKPFFSTEKYRQICTDLEQSKQVVCICPFLGDLEQSSSNTILFQTSFQPGHDALCVKLSLVRGDILKEVVDVIVNAANSKLDHIGGLAKAIADAGGSQIQRESTRYVQENGKVNAGKAICLSPGLLPFKKLIHSVGPRWMGGQNKESFQLYTAVHNSLCVANRENLQSIALPALGTGVFAVPVSVCAEESHRAVRNFCIYHPRACVKDIRFVLYTESDAKEFLKCFEQFSSQANESDESCTPVVQASATEQCSPLVSAATEQPLNWFWKNDSRTYSPYDSSTSRVLTQHYRSIPQGSCIITVNAKQYQVDFSTMQQTNLATRFSRKIRLEQDTPRLSLVEHTVHTVQWCYRDDRRRYSPYNPQDSATIERSYQDNKSIRLTITGKIYLIDFARMTQVNGETGYERPIRRQLSDSQSADMALQSAATPQHDEEERAVAVTSPEQFTVNLRGPKENLSKAVEELEHELSSCVKTEQMPLRKVPKSVKKSLKEVAAKHDVNITFSSKGRTATIKGYGDAHDKALLEMQKLVLAKMPEDEVEFPPEWEPQETNLKLVSVPTSSPEWQAVSSRFQSTMPSTTIRSIERIQNKWLWKKYAQHKKMIEEKNGGAGNEMELFHGTRDNMPSDIYDSEEGFDMRFSAKGMWGQANYFAVNAGYSNNYAHTNGMHKEMFLAKVLTGDSHARNPDRTLRMPPPKSYTAGVQLGQARYDTVNGTTNGSCVYMTYDNQKAYPAYLITYTDSYRRYLL